MKQRTKVDIESLLQWTYREELPKKALATECRTWGNIEQYGDRGGVEITWSKHPQRYAGIGPPHPDALQIDWLVRQLEEVRAAWSWVRSSLMPDLHWYLDGEDTRLERSVEMLGERRARPKTRSVVVTAMQASPMMLLIAHAQTQSRPIWNLGPPTLHRVPLTSNPSKHLVYGRTAGGRYKPAETAGQGEDGARCPLRLDPPAEEIAAARFDYAVWRDALAALVAEGWTLTEYEPLPPRAAARPWVIDGEPKAAVRTGRVLESNERLPLHPSRPIAGPPLRSEIEEASRRRPRRVPVTES